MEIWRINKSYEHMCTYKLWNMDQNEYLAPNLNSVQCEELVYRAGVWVDALSLAISQPNTPHGANDQSCIHYQSNN